MVTLGVFFMLYNRFMVMFTATAMDGPFSVFPILSICLFWKALSSKTVLYSVLTGIALAFGMLMTYATIFIGLFNTSPFCLVAPYLQSDVKN